MADINENALIKVDWDDSFSLYRPWHEREEVVQGATEEKEITTVGYLVMSDDRFVAMANSMWDEESDVAGVFYIPQGCIRRVTVLSTEGEIVYEDDSQKEE